MLCQSGVWVRGLTVNSPVAKLKPSCEGETSWRPRRFSLLWDLVEGTKIGGRDIEQLEPSTLRNPKTPKHQEAAKGRQAPCFLHQMPIRSYKAQGWKPPVPSTLIHSGRLASMTQVEAAQIVCLCVRVCVCAHKYKYKYIHTIHVCALVQYTIHGHRFVENQSTPFAAAGIAIKREARATLPRQGSCCRTASLCRNLPRIHPSSNLCLHLVLPASLTKATISTCLKQLRHV